jgi:sphingomyelin phosphodiesterase
MIDFAGQIAFLERELIKAQSAGERVLIIGHIPPEGPLITQINMYERIYRKYSKTIVAHLYGHHHCDYFQAYSDPENHDIATGVAYIGPVLTTDSNTNPGARLFKMNATSFEIIDVLTFFTNVTKANEVGELSWEFLYSAKEAYGLSDLSPQSWLQFATKLETNDQLWAAFDRNYYTAGESKCKPKDHKCRKHQICELKWMTDEQQRECKKQK